MDVKLYRNVQAFRAVHIPLGHGRSTCVANKIPKVDPKCRPGNHAKMRKFACLVNVFKILGRSAALLGEWEEGLYKVFVLQILF